MNRSAAVVLAILLLSMLVVMVRSGDPPVADPDQIAAAGPVEAGDQATGTHDGRVDGSGKKTVPQGDEPGLAHGPDPEGSRVSVMPESPYDLEDPLSSPLSENDWIAVRENGFLRVGEQAIEVMHDEPEYDQLGGIIWRDGAYVMHHHDWRIPFGGARFVRRDGDTFVFEHEGMEKSVSVNDALFYHRPGDPEVLLYNLLRIDAPYALTAVTDVKPIDQPMALRMPADVGDAGITEDWPSLDIFEFLYSTCWIHCSDFLFNMIFREVDGS